MATDYSETASQVERKKRRFRLFGKKKKDDGKRKGKNAVRATAATTNGIANKKTPARQVTIGKGGTPMSQLTMTGPSAQKKAQPKSLVNEFDRETKIVGYQDADGSRNPKTTTASSSPKTRTDKDDKKRSKSWLSGSKYFKQMADAAFDAIDADGSGEVDEKELYSGLLLIHLKLGSMAGPAACKPVDRQRVHQIFEKFDADDSGALDRQEFHEVMTVLTSNVVTRVLVQWSLTLMIVPMLAKAILDGIVGAFMFGYNKFMELDNIEEIEEQLGYYMGNATVYYETKVEPLILAKTPPVVMKYAEQAWDIINDIPENVWNTVPVTVLSAILGTLVVPYCIIKIDEFFDWLAERNKKKFESKGENRANI